MSERTTAEIEARMRVFAAEDMDNGFHADAADHNEAADRLVDLGDKLTEAIAFWEQHRAEAERLRAEVESMQRTAEVDKAFYDLTVLQRDAAWRELEQIRGLRNWNLA